ncbi:hypothetical protein BU16DRAFT_342792 [Lophium mytilinum]|uniref:Uncharacterized protein n=1 Tax=Lophium mytilinum TaxID=390894 RepID=A0A6A6QX93_9PEZI|nr:hypothetical protein BU16DRAFT_342792 [Lophium mytilinum]
MELLPWLLIVILGLVVFRVEATMFLFILILAIAAWFAWFPLPDNATVSEAESRLAAERTPKPAREPTTNPEAQQHTPKPRLKSTLKRVPTPPPRKPYVATPSPSAQELARLEAAEQTKVHPFTHPELFDMNRQFPGIGDKRPFITSQNKIRFWAGSEWFDEDFGFVTAGYSTTADGYFGQWVPYLEGSDRVGWSGGVRFQFRSKPRPRPTTIVKRAAMPLPQSPKLVANEPSLEPA